MMLTSCTPFHTSLKSIDLAMASPTPTLTSLPFEIRQLIYRHVIPEDAEIYISEADFDLLKHSFKYCYRKAAKSLSRSLVQVHNRPVSLLLTNKQVNAEVSRIPLTTVTLVLPDTFFTWGGLSALTSRERALITDISSNDCAKWLQNVAPNKATVEAFKKRLHGNMMRELKASYKSVETVWLKCNLEKVEGSCVFQTHTKAFFKVEGEVAQQDRNELASMQRLSAPLKH